MLFPGCSFCHTYPRLDSREAGNPETSIGTDKGEKKKLVLCGQRIKKLSRQIHLENNLSTVAEKQRKSVAPPPPTPAKAKQGA